MHNPVKQQTWDRKALRELHQDVIAFGRKHAAPRDHIAKGNHEKDRQNYSKLCAHVAPKSVRRGLHLCLKAQAHPVIGRNNVVRRFVQDRFIVQINVHIGQNSLFRRHPFDPFQCLFQMRMGRVRITAQGVNNPASQFTQMAPCLIWDCRDIGQIGNVVELLRFYQ